MKKKLKKAQSAIEFVMLTSAIIFFFTLFFVILNENISDKVRKRYNLAVEEIAVTVQDEINLASKSSEGYSREFKIPEDINGKAYDINLTSGMVYVITYDNKQAAALPVLSVIGNITKGTNLIKKEGGRVYLNP